MALEKRFTVRIGHDLHQGLLGLVTAGESVSSLVREALERLVRRRGTPDETADANTEATS